MMNFSWASVLLLALLPLTANTIRCYKCDASEECKTINNGGPSKSDYHRSENVEIIDCENYCWKAVSLGNVYRGCAKKRCAVSHSMGTFSSSVCCDTDYCNGSNTVRAPQFLFLALVASNVIYQLFS